MILAQPSWHATYSHLPWFGHAESNAAVWFCAVGHSFATFQCDLCKYFLDVTGPYTFQSFESWQQPGLSPAPLEAMKILKRLAADPGIVHIMSNHKWQVGKLSEMPPEGKVGVSPVCILGVNINAGQEISLRLRTDDLKASQQCP